MNPSLFSKLVQVICGCLLVAGCGSPVKSGEGTPGPSGAPSPAPAPSRPVTAPDPVSAAIPRTSLNSIAAGAYLARIPEQYGSSSWGGIRILDESPTEGWASPQGKLGPHVFVIALAQKCVIRTVEFDTKSTDGPGRGAKEVTVEIGDAENGPFQMFLETSLAEKADNQSFEAAGKPAGRFLRLTVKNNHGDLKWTELMDFRVYGEELTKDSYTQRIEGRYQADQGWGIINLRRDGASVTGCYRAGFPIDGGVEGRVVRFQWDQSEKDRIYRGGAVATFSPDGKAMQGFWWVENDRGERTSGTSAWYGSRIDETPGDCSGKTSGTPTADRIGVDLESAGRARVYGINFDLDSDRVRDESRPTLDRIVEILKKNPDWKMTVEGHTDALGGAEYNLKLSDRRATAVVTYLVAAGIKANRLTAVGFGLSRPVAPNETEIGRARNRRVELLKQ